MAPKPVPFAALAMALVLGLVTAAGAPAQDDRSAGLQERADALAQRFEAAASEPDRKLAAAEALEMAREEGVLVEGEEEMRTYLLAEAAEAVVIDEPFPLAFDAEGHALSELSAEFVAWATAQGLDPEVAAWSAMREHPVDIGRLVGETDPAVLAVFTDGLAARNYLVAIMAARGLAVADHTESIETIGTLADSSPSDVAVTLAEVLDLYTDPDAHALADQIRAENP